MTRAEQIAICILAGQALEVRSLVQDWLRSGAELSVEPPPSSRDPKVRAVAAAIIELLAARLNECALVWTVTVEPLSEPLYLVQAASRSQSLRARVERESPEPLRRRNMFAPQSYLEMI